MDPSAAFRLLALPLLLTAAACSPAPASPTPTPAPPPIVDRIAYIGSHTQLYTIRGDGSDRLMLTGGPVMRQASFSVGPAAQAGDQAYAWPTWAPDSGSLAVSWVSAGPEALVRMGIDIVDPLTGDAVTVFENALATAPRLIAAEAPHYAAWSSDGARLAILAQTASGLEAFVARVDEPGTVTDVASGAPVHMVWAPDRPTLLLHVSGDLFLADATSPTERSPSLAEESLAYRVPSWSWDGTRMAYVAAAAAGGNAVFVADANGENAREVADVGARAALVWSPAGDRIALTDSDDRAAPYFASLKIVETDSGSIRTLTSEPVLAFFWSGDGNRIAYVALDLARRAIAWKVVDAAGGEPVPLVDFAPSAAFFGMISFFDQYTASHSVWSPSNDRLVFAGHVTRGGAAPDGDDRVYVLDADGVEEPREIAKGSLAFWSWN